MTKGQRITKQLIVLIIFLMIIGGIGFGGYKVAWPTQPSPTPNPTANLLPISVVSTQLLNIENNDYDFVAKVTNPNTDYGSGDVEYELSFYNAQNSEIFTKTGSFYILPGQTKYLIETPLKFSEPVNRGLLAIKKVDWQQLDPVAATGVLLIPRGSSYTQIEQSGVFGKVTGTLTNNSSFDLNRVNAVVLLFDSEENILAVNRTEILTFLAATSRGFEVTWFRPFPGQVSRIEIETNTNVFENSNFLQRYQRPERFQQFF